jgi:hypothetical protein
MGIFAVVAQHQNTGQVAIAIQGTQNALDALKDFEIEQEPFRPIADAEISKGSRRGLLDLRRMENEDGVTLEDFLGALPSSTCLFITGHSLGGNLSSVLAPWIAAHIPAFDPPKLGHLSALPANLGVITFAAPTAGNAAFASFLDSQPGYQAYFNQNDVVPHAWAMSGPWNVAGVESLFPSPGANPAPAWVDEIIQKKIAQMQQEGAVYQQTSGETFAFPPKAAPEGVKSPWLWQLAYQHNYAYCRTFLGAGGDCSEPSLG